VHRRAGGCGPARRRTARSRGRRCPPSRRARPVRVQEPLTKASARTSIVSSSDSRSSMASRTVEGWPSRSRACGPARGYRGRLVRGTRRRPSGLGEYVLDETEAANTRRVENVVEGGPFLASTLERTRTACTRYQAPPFPPEREMPRALPDQGTTQACTSLRHSHRLKISPIRGLQWSLLLLTGSDASATLATLADA
jgi:hypothetical protein